MPDTDISKSISLKKVKDTVAEAAKIQEKALDEAKKLAESTTGGLLSGISSVVSNAKNVISQTLTGITDKFKDSVTKFASTVNHGLTSTLADLSKKSGSMMGDLQGKVNSGAVEEKLAFVVNTTNNSIDGASLFGQGARNNLLAELDMNEVERIMASTGLDKITTNADLTSAISTVSGNLSTLTANAKSLVSEVVNMPRTLTNAVTSYVNGQTNGLINTVKESVQDLASSVGIDLNSDGNLLRDMYDIYKMGKDTYDIVTGKDGAAILGITSRFNESFPEVQSLVQMAADICKVVNGKWDLSDFRQNKDLLDMLMWRLSNQGMYGAINDLMHCNDTQHYIDSRTLMILSDRMGAMGSKGDVYTASTLQQLVGNGRVSNVDSLMYDMARNMDDDPRAVNEYMNMLQRMNVDPSTLTGRGYVSGSKSIYINDVTRIADLSDSHPNLTYALLGDSDVGELSRGLVGIAV